MYFLVRQLLFQKDPEQAHDYVVSILKKQKNVTQKFSFLFRHSSENLKRTVWGMEFPNPLGLAGGFDKTGELYEVLSYLGFGFIECGTFTPLPQEGNPKPRLFRYPKYGAIVNRMGFNNPGVDAASRTFQLQRKTIPRGISIGKNKTTPNERAMEDYLLAFEKLHPFADYIAINVSSPNTPQLRDLQQSKELLDFVKLLKDKSKTQKQVPILIKLSPDLDNKMFFSLLEVYLDAGVDGIILTNTTTRKFNQYQIHEEGGISGLPLKIIATDMIKKAYKFTSGKIPIIGVGGIFDGKDALEKIMAGASLIQIYTGLVYRGPFLPKKILSFLDNFLEKENTTLNEITGINAK
ncbi:MAG: quinone-dependent dihydroorotate dehydrogenase [Leptospiraceae bacterium]|nr:quinone-dependent dihydroorotate dehydrogenase [Leptospiraceae bacterium]MDW7975969.1 quinone-dependent dihydroorotate dehydrogenase [Leptospiraceae bacterium]